MIKVKALNPSGECLVSKVALAVASLAVLLLCMGVGYSVLTTQRLSTLVDMRLQLHQQGLLIHSLKESIRVGSSSSINSSSISSSSSSINSSSSSVSQPTGVQTDASNTAQAEDVRDVEIPGDVVASAINSSSSNSSSSNSSSSRRSSSRGQPDGNTKSGSLPRGMGPIQIPNTTSSSSSSSNATSSSSSSSNATSSNNGERSSSSSSDGSSSSNDGCSSSRTDSSSSSNSSSSSSPGVVPPEVPSPPPFTINSSYDFMLTRLQRERGFTYLGSQERLRLALDRAVKSQVLTVGLVGGSITLGQGAVGAPSWAMRVEAWLNDAFGPASPVGAKVVVNNGGVAGTSSSYITACFSMHVPANADIVMVEYAENDLHPPGYAGPVMDNALRRPFERLLRKALSLPHRPAVILVNAYAWKMKEPEGVYWLNAERDFYEFATYYNLPMVSVKACCYGELMAGKAGYQTNETEGTDSPRLKGKVFYYDKIHPSGWTGHRVMGELVINLILQTATNLQRQPILAEERSEAASPLRPPMLPGNHAAHANACLMGPAFKNESVIGAEGWEWVNESQGLRPKWGYVSRTPGRVLEVRVNTTATSGGAEAKVMVKFAYLASYEHMGKAEFSCLRGCACDATTIDCHWQQKVSLLQMHTLYATQAPECVIGITVLNATSSGEHKVKIAAVIVSEEAGMLAGIGAVAEAIEYVHDVVSYRNKPGLVFDVRDHV